MTTTPTPDPKVGPFTGWIRVSMKEWKPVAMGPSEKSCWDQTFHYRKVHDLDSECVALPTGLEPNPGHSVR